MNKNKGNNNIELTFEKEKRKYATKNSTTN